ncbi:response regulator [Methanobacterium sp. ACI-7]|uniref:response regulator n=1 Tax=unclassified Methanobacterium TaxID=2627676 RepID=UPI0039C0E62A
MEDKLIRVLIIEDNPVDLRLIEEMLGEINSPSFELESSKRLEDGLKLLLNDNFDILLLDLSLPDSAGLDTFASVYEQAPELPIVILSGFDDEDTAIRAVREGAQDYLVKGQVSSLLLSRAISYAIERKLIEDELIRHRYYLNELVEKRTEELEEANECLQEEVREKEILIEEIYRRIQFTLQIITGIIGVNTLNISNEDLNELNIKSQTRMNAIMQLNDILDQSEDFAMVDFYKYSEDIIKYLSDIYAIDKDTLNINLDMEGVLLDISTVIPLGLILNELLSDKLKKPYEQCDINIKLNSDNGNVKLAINYGECCQNGDEYMDESHLQLIGKLLEQFNGSIGFNNENSEVIILLNEIKV